MILGAFNMINPNHNFPTWRHRSSKVEVWDDLAYWRELAQLLDQAGFDFLFFADNYGYPTVDGQPMPEVASEGIMFPTLDPVVFAAALLAVTQNIGLVVTSSTMTDLPYAFARRFSTLDRLGDGRIGWNIVTGTAQGTLAELFGLGEEMSHGDRYDKAQEYVDLATTLWEHSWDDDAWRNDAEAGVLIDPAKVHVIHHHGTYFDADGLFVAPPTRQRTPALFQAGTSERGRDFAARNAEAVFVAVERAETMAGWTADIRERAVAHGRRPDDVKLLTSATVIIGATTEEAMAKRDAVAAAHTYNVAAVWFAGFTGIDLRAFPEDEPMDPLGSAFGKSDLDKYFVNGARPTPREIVEDFLAGNGNEFQFVGTAAEVADSMIDTVGRAGLDGLMIEPTFGNAEGYVEFVEHVMPILRARGAVSAPDAGGSLRSRLFPGAGDRLNERHPARQRGRSAGK